MHGHPSIGNLPTTGLPTTQLIPIPIMWAAVLAITVIPVAIAGTPSPNLQRGFDLSLQLYVLNTSSSLTTF